MTEQVRLVPDYGDGPDPRKGEYRDGQGQIRICQACNPRNKARKHTCGLAGLQATLRIG